VLPTPREGVQSVSVGRSWSDRARAELRAATFVALSVGAIWASCSAESYHAAHSGLSTGTGGGAGVAPTGGAGGVGAAGSGGSGGDGSALAGTTGGIAGDNGAAGAGAAGSDAGGAPGAAGVGAAGAGAVGMGAAGAGAAGAGAAGAGTAGAGAAGAGAAGTGATQPPAPLALPMTVSDHYSPTGGMGDAAVAGSVTIGSDGGACAGAPAAALKGACYTVTYKPQPFAAGANATWAGFYWQYPDNNWGAMQPLTVAGGANDVSFYAKGMAGGESITFEAGGIMSQGSPYFDGFSVNQTYKLTNTWTKYTLPMTGMTYAGGVLGAFAWVASVSNQNTMTFFVTGIVWE